MVDACCVRHLTLVRVFLCLGLNQLAIQLESKQAHTSFGKLPLSDERTAPIPQFGKAKREDASKCYIGELTVQENVGRGSPAPTYNYVDNIKYKDVSALEVSDFKFAFFHIGPKLLIRR